MGCKPSSYLAHIWHSFVRQPLHALQMIVDFPSPSPCMPRSSSFWSQPALQRSLSWNTALQQSQSQNRKLAPIINSITSLKEVKVRVHNWTSTQETKTIILVLWPFNFCFFDSFHFVSIMGLLFSSAFVALSTPCRHSSPEKDPTVPHLQNLRVEPKTRCLITRWYHLQKPILAWPSPLRMYMEVTPTKCSLHSSPFRPYSHLKA
jgi:hypothetical protein